MQVQVSAAVAGGRLQGKSGSIGRDAEEESEE